MSINFNSIQMLGGLLTSVVSSTALSVWWVAQREKRHEMAFYKLSSQFEIFKTAYYEQQEHQKYLIKGVIERVDHKGERLRQEIKELEQDFREFRNK